jgi:hypothetical protein
VEEPHRGAEEAIASGKRIIHGSSLVEHSTRMLLLLPSVKDLVLNYETKA